MAEIKISYIHFFKNPYKVGNRDKYSKMEVWIKTQRENTASWGEGGRRGESMRAHISLLYPRSKWNYSPHTGFTGSEQGRGGREPGAGRGRGRGCRCISPRRTGRRQRCSRRNASGSIHGPLSSRSHSHGGCGSRSLGRLEDGEERLTVVSWCVFFFFLSFT